MPFSSGTFSRVHDFTDDRDNGIRIQASRMDAEMDGIATGLSTALLKDGTQTATATIPFAAGISIIDNQKITLGTNSDITLQYDETTNDSLEIAANVEGAALGIVLKSDQGDDNADQHKLSIADGGVLTLGSKISGSFVDYLTHTPNSTVASSTLAVAGNLTVGGNLTLGSGAVLSEAELEQLDGITAGTVTASKAVVVDTNKDIASFRNVTLTGELDAGSLDISGDADIDGTLEADAMTLNGSAITTVATLSTGISNGNLPVFTSGVADDDFLRVNGTAIEGRSASEVLSDIGGQAALTFGISNTNIPIFTSGVVDDDFLRVNGTSIEGRSASEVLSDIGASAVAGSSSIVTTGALDSGSITSGFGNINNGTSTLTTGNTDINGTVAISGDTTLEDGADLITASAGTSNVRIGVNAGNSIASGGNYNTVVGDEAGTALTTGDNNVAVGFEALKTEDGHGQNVAVGYRALKTLNAGGDAHNTAVGNLAGEDVTTGTGNTLIGSLSGMGLTTGGSNTALGYNSLEVDTAGSKTVAIGFNALQAQNFSSATDSHNTAVGYNAGLVVTTGVSNTLIGSLAGDALTDADNNVAVGYLALSTDIQGSRSTAIGNQALQTQSFSSATEVNNTAVGFFAGQAMTTGQENTLHGSFAGADLTDANDNTAVGYRALSTETRGTRNTAIGHDALRNQNTTSSTNIYNTAVGHSAGESVTTATNLTLIGGLAGDALTTGADNVAVGYLALSTETTGIRNTAIGYQALKTQNKTDGSALYNVGLGYNAGASATDGGNNTFLGSLTGTANTSGSNNTFVGYSSGNDVTTGIQNTIVGGLAGDALTDADYNTVLGYSALSADTKGSRSVAIGYSALLNQNFTSSTDANNVGIGFEAGKTSTDGCLNGTFIGYQAGKSNTGTKNTFIGASAGSEVTGGGSNVVIGRYNGNQGGIDIRTASNNIVLSDGDGVPRMRIDASGYFHVATDIADSEFFNVASYHSISTTNTQPALFVENSGSSGNAYGLVIDFTDVAPDNNTSYFFQCQDSSAIRMKVWGDGDVQNHDNSYGALSDEKLKEQITDASSQWNDLKALKVRKFKMKEDVAKGDSDDHWRLGVVAQEVETAGMNGLVKNNPDMITNEDGDLVEGETITKSVKYSILYMKAVKALQEAMTRIETLEADVKALKGE